MIIINDKLRRKGKTNSIPSVFHLFPPFQGIEQTLDRSVFDQCDIAGFTVFVIEKSCWVFNGDRNVIGRSDRLLRVNDTGVAVFFGRDVHLIHDQVFRG